MTPNEAAMNILLSSRTEREVTRRMTALKHRIEVASGLRCPQCGGTNVQSNEARSRWDLMVLCEDCNETFDCNPD